MTLQQMRYLIAIFECGSISAAAKRMFVSQSSLSEALREAESETGITIFKRTNHGVEATLEGVELIGMVRQVIQQDDMIASRYGFGAQSDGDVKRLAISTQRYSFAIEALAELMDEHESEHYSFVFRETDTGEIISDVRSFRSDLGILYLSSHNSGIIKREIERAGTTFHPIATVAPHVLVSESHPLAKQRTVRLQDLEQFPRVVFEQGGGASTYFSEEPLPEAPYRNTVSVRDRSTVAAILALTNAYTIATGIRVAGMYQGISVLPLNTRETMEIGYVTNSRVVPSQIALEYLDALKRATEAATSSTLNES